MIVVSDTSPLLYLFLIDFIDLLPKLFEQVIVPEAVMSEISSPGSPTKLQEWAKVPPQWLTVKSVEVELNANIRRLDAGEQAAICLAKSLKADMLLVDEKLGRQAAITEGLQIIGTLGILDEAARAKLIDIEAAVIRLQQTNFRASSKLINSLLETHRND